MTDEHLDRVVRDADPFRPELIGHLGGAEQTLLEEIMSVPQLESVPGPAPEAAPAAPRRRAWRRLATAVAAAAVVTGVIGASVLLRDQPPAEPWAGPVGLPEAGAGGGYQLDLKAVEGLPRLLIQQDGWKVTTVYGFASESGTINFVNGARSLEMTWYQDEHYDDYYKDRLLVSAPQPATVAGREAAVFTYSASDFAAMLKPQDGTFVELRTGGTWTRTEFDAVLPHIARADAETFLAALPPQIVTPGRVHDEAAKILTDVPMPPGFDINSVDVAGANDPYQFGAHVTGQVTCTWIAEWIRADKAGDDAAVKKAASALRSSRNWKVLNDMNAEGDYPEVLWEVAGKVAGGKVPEWYKDGLGC
ncbi:hypothetical protein AB0M02_10260 [Actinoplanes sp. NPDC051861]|uniref:hypothetical protein n=1 Tax=Actinoplanes sp. NPDC051861 TaxID=3155170 RepID=UPI0034126558